MTNNTEMNKISLLLSGISVNCHSSIRIEKAGAVLYIDPYNLTEAPHDADVIFITHPHHDHLSLADTDKAGNADTVFVCTPDSADELIRHGIDKQCIVIAKPCCKGKLKCGIEFKAFCAYNCGKAYHPKEKDWVGYRIKIDGGVYIVLGDTDANDELKDMRADVLFAPIGGKYTMTAIEAAHLTNEIMPKVVVPVHYGSLIGDSRDEQAFVAQLDENIHCQILL